MNALFYVVCHSGLATKRHKPPRSQQKPLNANGSHEIPTEAKRCHKKSKKARTPNDANDTKRPKDILFYTKLLFLADQDLGVLIPRGKPWLTHLHSLKNGSNNSGSLFSYGVCRIYCLPSGPGTQSLPIFSDRHSAFHFCSPCRGCVPIPSICPFVLPAIVILHGTASPLLPSPLPCTALLPRIPRSRICTVRLHSLQHLAAATSLVYFILAICWSNTKPDQYLHWTREPVQNDFMIQARVYLGVSHTPLAHSCGLEGSL